MENEFRKAMDSFLTEGLARLEAMSDETLNQLMNVEDPEPIHQAHGMV